MKEGEEQRQIRAIFSVHFVTTVEGYVHKLNETNKEGVVYNRRPTRTARSFYPLTPPILLSPPFSSLTSPAHRRAALFLLLVFAAVSLSLRSFWKKEPKPTETYEGGGRGSDEDGSGVNDMKEKEKEKEKER